MVSDCVRGHALTDVEGRFTSVDGLFAEIVGIPVAELRDRSLLEITHDADRDRNLAQLHNLKSTGRPFVIEKRYVRPAGDIVWVENHVSVMQQADGQVGLVASTRRLSRPRPLGAPSDNGSAADRNLIKDIIGLQRERKNRAKYFGDLLCDDADWDMLLAALLSKSEHKLLTVSGLAYMSGVSLSTGLRHIRQMEAAGYLIRQADQSDQRRSLLQPTEKAWTALRDFLSAPR